MEIMTSHILPTIYIAHVYKVDVIGWDRLSLGYQKYLGVVTESHK